MTKLTAWTLGLAACWMVFGSVPLNAQDWPGLRGINGTGVSSESSVLSRTSKVDLKVRWKIQIGSGYSSVVVADDKVLALYSGMHAGNGESKTKQDLISAFDISNGKKIWTYSMGPYFVGKNGSFDGPLATPLVHGERVYGLSATGRLFCLELNTGESVWERELKSEMMAPQPMYGFTTSPVLAGGNLIVQVGAKDKSVVAFNLKTGKTEWSVGNDVINSQTPFVTKIKGREIVLAFGGKKLVGVDPKNGELAFEFEHGGGNGSAVTPVPIGSNKFLLTLDDAFSKAVSLQSNGSEITVSEEWKTRSIRNTYNVPVLINGNVYAYSTRILTCVDPETGRAKWKSRTPGDGFLIGIDGHFLASTKKGGLHLAKASANKYEEVASLKLFKDLVWSIPAYSNNSVFVRSLNELARVDIVPKTSVASKSNTSAMPMGKKFAAEIAKIEAGKSASTKQEMVKSFLGSQKSFPIVEDDVVHFVYSGKGKDIAVASDIFGSRQERKMKNVEGTNLFYFNAKLPKDQRANYIFLVDYEIQTDPRNDRQNTSTLYAGEMEFAVRLRNAPPLKMSWFAMPDWKQPAYLPLPEKMVGTLEEKRFGQEKSKTKIDVYLPPSYAKKTDRKYPVCYITGNTALSQGNVAKIVDSIYQAQSKTDRFLAPEAIVVFVGVNPMAPTALNVKKLVEFVDANYRTKSDRDSRICVGFGFESAAALMALSANSDLFSAASVHSPLLFDAARSGVLAGMRGLKHPVTLHVEWGRYDMFNPHENWDLRGMTKTFVDEAKKSEKVTITGGEVNDSTDWSSWRNRIDNVLRLLVVKKAK